MQDVVKLVVNGLELQTFESFELKNSMSSATTDFSFTYAPKSKIVNGQYVLIDLIKPQDPVLVFINDIKYLTGYIVSTEWSESASSDLITVPGMDAVSYCLLRHNPRPKTYKIKDFTALVRTAVEDNGFADIIAVQNITLVILLLASGLELLILRRLAKLLLDMIFFSNLPRFIKSLSMRQTSCFFYG